MDEDDNGKFRLERVNINSPAVIDPTPEAEASQSLLASVRAKIDPISMVGKRLVSEKEWELLQKDVSDVILFVSVCYNFLIT